MAKFFWADDLRSGEAHGRLKSVSRFRVIICREAPVLAAISSTSHDHIVLSHFRSLRSFLLSRFVHRWLSSMSSGCARCVFVDVRLLMHTAYAHCSLVCYFVSSYSLSCLPSSCAFLQPPSLRFCKILTWCLQYIPVPTSFDKEFCRIRYAFDFCCIHKQLHHSTPSKTFDLPHCNDSSSPELYPHLYTLRQQDLCPDTCIMPSICSLYSCILFVWHYPQSGTRFRPFLHDSWPLQPSTDPPHPPSQHWGRCAHVTHRQAPCGTPMSGWRSSGLSFPWLPFRPSVPQKKWGKTRNEKEGLPRTCEHTMRGSSLNLFPWGWETQTIL